MNLLFFTYLPFKSTSSKKDDNLSNNIEEAETMDVAHASSIATSEIVSKEAESKPVFHSTDIKTFLTHGDCFIVKSTSMRNYKRRIS